MLGWVGHRTGDRDCEPAELTEHQATVGLGRVNVPTSLQYPLERHRNLERRWQRLLDELARPASAPTPCRREIPTTIGTRKRKTKKMRTSTKNRRSSESPTNSPHARSLCSIALSEDAP